MIAKLPITLATALALAGLAAPLAAQGSMTDEHAYYDFYDAGFDDRSYEDDWFYDYYAHEALPADDTFAQADLDDLEHEFEWEDEGLFD